MYIMKFCVQSSISIYEYSKILIDCFVTSDMVIMIFHVYFVTCAGVKKSLVIESETSKISIRTSIYFHPMSNGQIKNIQCQVICPLMVSIIWQQDK